MTDRFESRSIMRTAKWFVTTALVISLTGCALLTGPKPEHPQRATPPSPDTEPVYVVGGSAADNESIFTEVLRDFSTSEAQILGKSVVDALINVGFDRDHLQVSFDRTKTDLYVDSVFVAARFDQECLIGQLATDDREFAVHLTSTVGPENDVCLIGETREIDW